jgi:hypothetical protein
MALTNAEKIAEVEAAIHAIITGTQVRVFVDQNGERVEFNTTNLSRLQAYLASLTVSTPNVGPIGFFF